MDELEKLKGILTIGFADDTNVLALGRDTQSCCTSIEKAWKICKTWADSRGMSFNPAKSELLHYISRKPKNQEKKVSLAGLGGQGEAFHHFYFFQQ
jgi:hypothetical protein